LVRALLLFLMLLFLARAVWRLLEGVVRGATELGDTPRPKQTSPPGVKMAQCPACGTYVVPGKSISGVRGGQTVYYCSERCRGAA
jgi:hypothetical protein